MHRLYRVDGVPPVRFRDVLPQCVNVLALLREPAMQLTSIIANQDVKGPGKIVTTNPATGAVIAEVSALDETGARHAVAAARDAYPAWSATSLAERQRLLASWLELMVAEADSLAELVAREGGTPVAEARLVDVFPGCEVLNYLSRRLPALLAFKPVKPRVVLFSHWRAGYRFDPLGVIAVVAPWNYPVGIPMNGIAAAIAAGNTVVFKPASATVLIGLALGDMARRAGFPPGVVNTVALPGRATDALIDDPAVAKVLFTGSVGVGKRVAQRLAGRLIPAQLELGGKDPAVVAADCDVERTAHGLVWGAFMNTGQTCASIERAYVERPVYDRLLHRVVAMTKALRMGDPFDEHTDVGPMTTEEQREEVHRQVQDALAGGARALAGGVLPEGPGLFYPPTVLVDVREEMAVMQEETFGPVLPIVPVGSIDEGIARANASRFGLCASGWTRSRATAHRLQRELEAGVVMINESVVAFGESTATWGGVKESGIGRTHGPYGLLEMCNIKYVAADYGRDRAMPWYYPYDADFGRFMASAIPALYSRGARKAGALAKLAGTRRFLGRVRKGTVLANPHRLR
jgi:acyl-CoA reductase-like NAD-dependent aldehyde dehydrogenase